ncbi:MAG: dihydroorotate dehydrogenase [Deltaproteobacteria bacterium]|nr:dihydroorotate dehydrogenase [Deltaproteobacteria bacterium]
MSTLDVTSTGSGGDPRLAVRIAGIALPNPTVLASGILGMSASSCGFAVAHGAGAVTFKSCGLEPRGGHPCPAVVPYEHGLLNAIGLSNPGAERMAEEIAQFRSRFEVPVFASIFGRTVDEFGTVAAIVAGGRPDLIEVNVSCPNVESEFGTPFGLDPGLTAAITRVVKKAAKDIPVAIKLSPQAHGIGRLARTCQDAGADAITAINTVGPGMIIDPELRRPVLSNRVGGLSGGAILPVAVRCVYEIASQVTIPIIGTGGVSRAEHALQLVLAGATAVGIGSGVREGGDAVFSSVCRGLSAYLDRHGLDCLETVRGAAHA